MLAGGRGGAVDGNCGAVAGGAVAGGAGDGGGGGGGGGSSAGRVGGAGTVAGASLVNTAASLSWCGISISTSDCFC